MSFTIMMLFNMCFINKTNIKPTPVSKYITCT